MSQVPVSQVIPKTPWTPAQRIGHLRFLHGKNAQAIVAWENVLLQNIMDMSEEEKIGIPIVEIRAALASFKAMSNVISKLLAQAFEAVRVETPVRSD